MFSRIPATHRFDKLAWIKGLLAGLLMCSPVLANAWWNADWAYRKKITLDGAETPALGGQVQQVLVPVRLHAGNFPFGDAQQAGADLRFVAADDKTPLNFHVEQFDSLDEIAIVWVQVPSIGAKDSAVFMYYGNAAAPAAGSSKASFDPHTVAAFHFTEREGSPQDATGYANHASTSGGKLGAAGAIGFGLGLATDQSMRIAGTPALATPVGTGLTVSLWAKAADAAATGTLLTRDEVGRRLVFGLLGGKPYLTVSDGGQGASIAAEKPLDGGTWHHLAFTLGERARLFVDGDEVASGAVRLPEFKSDLLLGAGAAGTGGFSGEIDELQIANLMRPPEWLRAAALGQHPQSKLVQYGGDESGGGIQYTAVLRTLANSTSLDGWIIIGIIGAMGLISFEVMVAKLLLLRRMKRQNDEFRSSFRDASSPLARMDPAAAEARVLAWPDSPLFRLYHTGVKELTSVRKATGGDLTPQALEVVRAGIDATMVEESHRLNDRLVLLTLSVSGAPFLGLLGTVVGIMITFGTIAMIGDVNVNTIAPGVAAALTTTVAGLIVAIPVMFGYNQLATQIRELSTGMEVFANELLGKLALRSSLLPVVDGAAVASVPALQAAVA